MIGSHGDNCSWCSESTEKEDDMNVYAPAPQYTCEWCGNRSEDMAAISACEHRHAAAMAVAFTVGDEVLVYREDRYPADLRGVVVSLDGIGRDLRVLVETLEGDLKSERTWFLVYSVQHGRDPKPYVRKC